jgi:Mrp family chromosome partitioning ATPase
MVMVIRGGKTRRKPLLGAVGELRRARANIIGVVLNAADLSKDGASYSGYYRDDHYGLYGREESDHFAENK